MIKLRFWRIPLVVLGGLGILFVIRLSRWPEDSSKQTLPDGTFIVLSGLKIGRTNTYTHGTLLSKTLGRFVPSKGLRVLGFKLERPSEVTFPAVPLEGEVLSARLRLMPGSPREQSFLSPPFYRKYRLLISGGDGFTFVKEFNGFKKYADGLFSYIHCSSCPRDSRVLHFPLEERDQPQDTNWREVVSFLARNPKPAQIENWHPQSPLRIVLREDLEVEVGELTVHSEPVQPDQFWEHSVLLPARFTSQGQILTNWGIYGGPIRDASGNFEYFTAIKEITNDWTVYRAHRPLDPAKPWRLQVGFALDSNFPASNLFSFTVPWPLPSTIQTNLGEHAVRIDYVNTDMLSVELLNKLPKARLTLVAARDGQGNDLDDWTGSWGQHSFWKKLKLSAPVQVHATVAIHSNFPAEFTLQPRYEKPAGRPKVDSVRPAQ